ncbi:hypothetical protein EDE04_7368 [Streptomyces sp. 2132.2]|nr:hypothetical protein EDE04_7368 [Streptomyces sp. 2132.2]
MPPGWWARAPTGPSRRPSTSVTCRRSGRRPRVPRRVGRTVRPCRSAHRPALHRHRRADPAAPRLQLPIRRQHLATEPTDARAYTGTRITRDRGVRYEHDAQGRVVLRQKTRLSRKPDTWRYTSDADDRLTEVTPPQGNPAVWADPLVLTPYKQGEGTGEQKALPRAEREAPTCMEHRSRRASRSRKDDVSMLQRYWIPDGGDPIRIQESIIGPQTDPTNYTDRARLIPVGPPVEIPR